MNTEKVKAALAEARRFIKRGTEYVDAVNLVNGREYSVPKESGSVRRASLDLTRALAEMRKP